MMLGLECSRSDDARFRMLYFRQVLWGRRTKRRGFVSLVRHVYVCVHPCMHACVCPRHVLWTRQTKSRDFVSLVRHAHVCMYACMYASMCMYLYVRVRCCGRDTRSAASDPAP